MGFVKIRGKLLTVCMLIVLAVSFGIGFYIHNRHTVLTYDEYKDVEIFDISKGEVIKTIQSNPVIQKEAEKYLKSITGMYAKVKAFPESGYIIRVPLEPPVKVQGQWLTNYGIDSVDEVFILFPGQGTPYLLVLDERSRPLFYNFEGNTDVLLKILDFNPGTF